MGNLSKKNLNKITVKEIIEKAGYNRSTFYYHFKNTEEILEYLENEILDSLFNVVSNINSYKSNLEFTHNIIKIYEKYGDYFYFLLSTNGDSNFIIKFSETTKKIFYNNHKNEKYSLEELELTHAFISSAFIGSFLYWFKKNNSTSFENFLDS